MLRSVMLSLLALLSWQAQAAYQCEVNPQDDIFITLQQVQVFGTSGNLVISPQGDVTRNQTALTLTAAQRQQAKAYQADLRQLLPWIEQGAQAHLEKARVALDGVIAKQLGSDSNMRAWLSSGGNPLQVVMGNLGNLQQVIQTEWNSQELTFQLFGNDICQRVISLENQSKRLLKSLP